MKSDSFYFVHSGEPEADLLVCRSSPTITACHGAQRELASGGNLSAACSPCYTLGHFPVLSQPERRLV